MRINEELRFKFLLRHMLEQELLKGELDAESLKASIKKVTMEIRELLKRDGEGYFGSKREYLNVHGREWDESVTCREWVTDKDDIEWLETSTEMEKRQWLDENNPCPYIWREYSPTGQRYVDSQRFVKYPNRGWAYIYEECIDC